MGGGDGSGSGREVQGDSFQWASFNPFVQMQKAFCSSLSLGLLCIEWLSSTPPTLRLQFLNYWEEKGRKGRKGREGGGEGKKEGVGERKGGGEKMMSKELAFSGAKRVPSFS